MHNLKWDFYLGHPLPRIASYIIGLAGFVLATAIWLKNLKILIGSFLIAVAGGLACLISYGSDAIAILRSNNRKHNDDQ